MSPATAPALVTDHETRIVRLEEWREHHEEDVRRREKQSADFELRLRAVEAAQLRLAVKMATWATVGSALATVLVQVVLKVVLK